MHTQWVGRAKAHARSGLFYYSITSNGQRNEPRFCTPPFGACVGVMIKKGGCDIFRPIFLASELSASSQAKLS